MTNRLRTPQALCRFGLATCDITPPRDIYHHMWGAATHDQAEGIHRPLSASAFVWQPYTENTHERRVFVALDHCVLMPPEMTSLIQRVNNDHALTKDSLRVNFSHTHAAGLLDPDFRDRPGGAAIPPYLDQMAVQISETVGNALQNVKPACVTYVSGRCSLAAHRDYWDEERKTFVCGLNPGGAADDTVLVARVTSLDGTPRAAVINYACHPTTLAWENRMISPDFPGAMRDLITGQTGVPCVFLQGASGDVGPVQGYVGDTEVADRNGRQLGHAALAAWESMPPPSTDYVYGGPVVSGATLGIWEHVPLQEAQRAEIATFRTTQVSLDIPYDERVPGRDQLQADLQHWEEVKRTAVAQGQHVAARDAHAQIERARRWLGRIATLPEGTSYPYRIQLDRVGDAVWVTVPGEPYNLLQRVLRQRFPGRPLIVCTLAEGSLPLYLPDRDTYGKGVYQEEIALLEAGCLESVTAAAAKGIAELFA